MLNNYLKTAWRSTLRQKTFSIINIFGLAVSISVCLIGIMLIRDAYCFDRFHPHPEQVFRINTEALRKGGGEERYASSQHALARALTEKYPYTEAWAPLGMGLSGNFTIGSQTLRTASLNPADQLRGE